MIGYGWYGCTGSANHGPANIPYPGYHIRDPPRAREWDMDFGEPTGACNETGGDTGIFSREPFVFASSPLTLVVCLVISLSQIFATQVTGARRL